MYKPAKATLAFVSTLALIAVACTDDGGDEGSADGETVGDGDGDGDVTGDGDGDATGDGDGDATGDGDGDATGDGDGDATGDGDGDATGDGDGDAPAACMGAVAPAGSLAVGQQFSHWPGGFDLEGNAVDYCEFAGKPILFILSAGWCGPCHDLAAGMTGGASSWDPGVLAPVIAGMEADTLEVVEFIVDNYIDFSATSLADLQNWESMHPNEHIHLIGDPTVGVNGEEPMWQYLGPVHNGGVPAGLLIDADFNVEVMDLQGAITTAGQKYGG